MSTILSLFCINKTIGLLSKLQLIFPRHPLKTIYKTFVRPHLDYGDAIYDHAFNESFHQRLESVQYNAAIAITGAIRNIVGEVFSRTRTRNLEIKTLV